MTMAKKQRLSPVSLIQQYMEEGEGAESTRLLSSLANGGATKRDKTTLSLSDTGAANYPANDVVRVEDNKPANQPANYPANEPDISGLPANEPVTEPASCPANHKANQPASYPVNNEANKPANHATNYQANEPAIKKDPQIWYPFTEKQGRILLYLIMAGGVTKREQIATDTGINIATIKHALRVFAQGGYIANVKLYTMHSYRGFSYAINPLMCNEFAERLTGKSLEYPANHPASYPANRPTCYPAKYPASPPPPLSSSLEKKLTTTENQDLLSDPELAYWKGFGVTDRKVQQWAEEFEMDLEQVILSLKYCRYEMVVLNYEEEKQIRKPQDWFYRVMQRSGLYPKPSNYKSIAELRIEQMEQGAREAKALRERQQRAEKALEFQRIMSDPDSQEYKDLLNQASEFSKDAGGSVLIDEMESIFMGTRIASHEDLARTD